MKRTILTIIAVLVVACLLIVGGTAIAARDSQQQRTVTTWSDIEIQEVNAVRISGTSLRLEMTYLGKSQKQDAYPFFFQVTDQSGDLVAQLDVPVDSVSPGKVVSGQYEIRIPTAVVGQLRIVMGRFNPVDATRIATINGLQEVEVGMIDMN